MTVTYQRKVAEADGLKFLRMMFRWRGGIVKGVHLELAYYFLVYYLIALFSNVFLRPNESGELFRSFVKYCNEARSSFFAMVGFVLQFNATQIYLRWWAVYTMLPWPDNLCFEIGTYIQEKRGIYEEEELQLRKTMVRYLSLTYVLVFRDISERIRSRFPTLNHLEGTLLTKNERIRLEETNKERAYWMPIEWIEHILKNFYKRGQIQDFHYGKILQSVLDYREKLHNILQYDTVNLPLLYTQTVHLIVYTYFVLSIFAAQNVEQYPIQNWDWFTFFANPGRVGLEFLILVGWLKAGDIMINPFGNDDDDFEMHLLVERNFLVSYSTVEHFPGKAPKKEDIRMAMTMPRGTKDSMIEDLIRGHNRNQGSAVPDKANPETPLITPRNISIEHSQNGKSRNFRITNRKLKSTVKRKKTSKKKSVKELPSRRLTTTPLMSANPSEKEEKKSDDLAAQLVENLKFLQRVEAKRDRIEDDFTQRGDDEEDEDDQRRQPATPRGSAIQSRVSSKTRSKKKKELEVSDTQRSQQSLSSKKSLVRGQSRQAEFESLVKKLKNSTENTRYTDK